MRITFDRVRIRLRFCARWKDNLEWDIIMSKIFEKKSKMEMKNEEEKNYLLLGLCYKYHFYMSLTEFTSPCMSESSILEHHHCGKNFQKLFNFL